TAHLRGIGLTSPQGGIAVGEAAVDSALVEAPLDAQSPISSTVDAAARNIRVSDAQGDTLSIGSVEQLATAQAAGRPGTAHATRTLVISDVILTQAGGQPNVICHGACAGDPEQFASHINGSGLPIRILDPTPESFLLGGSPGGYTSAVVAGSAEQLG